MDGTSTSSERLPPGHELDLVEIDGSPASGLEVRNDSDMLFEQPPEVLSGHADEAFILERREQVGVARVATFYSLATILAQKCRLAAPTNTHGCDCLFLALLPASPS